MIKKIFLLPSLMLLFLPLAYSYGWENATLQSNAQVLCAEFSECINLKCTDEISEGVSYPSYVDLDFGRMDQYRQCKPSVENWCQIKDDSCQDCTTGDITNNGPMNAMNFYLNMAKGASGCQIYKEVGKAYNYFLQSKEYWHQVKGEKSFCAENFEKDVDKFYKSSQYNGWTVQSCEKLVHSTDFDEWREEFADIVVSELGATRKTQAQQSQTSAQQSNQAGSQTQTQQQCILEGVKYVGSFCTGSRKVEGAISTWTKKDPFSVLLLVFGVYFLYSFLFKRK